MIIVLEIAQVLGSRPEAKAVHRLVEDGRLLK